MTFYVPCLFDWLKKGNPLQTKKDRLWCPIDGVHLLPKIQEKYNKFEYIQYGTHWFGFLGEDGSEYLVSSLGYNATFGHRGELACHLFSDYERSKDEMSAEICRFVRWLTSTTLKRRPYLNTFEFA